MRRGAFLLSSTARVLRALLFRGSSDLVGLGRPAGMRTLEGLMVKPFAAKTGVNVIEDEYDQKLAEIRAQVEAKSLKWDVIMVGPSVGPLACDEGLLEDLSARA